MIIGDRLKAVRESKNLSQGHIEQRTGLLRCYISRVENGHTVPSIDTLEKIARALEVPLYQLFYDSDAPPKALAIVKGDSKNGQRPVREQREIQKVGQLFLKLNARDQGIVRAMMSKLAARA